MDRAPYNWTGRIARAFVENDSLAALVIVVAVAFGVAGYMLTPKQYNPEITRPAFIVTVPYPGATPDEAFTLVGRELVEKVSALAGVDEVTLVAQDGGLVSAVVIFDVGFDEATARVNLQTQLSQHSYLARGDIGMPVIREQNPDEVPVLTVRLTGDRSLGELREAAVALSDVLARVDDVASVDVHGGYPPALVVEVRPEALTRSHVSMSEVLTAVHSASGEFPLTALHGGERIVLVDIENAGRSPETLADVAVAPDVRLGDIATIYRGTAEVRSYTRYALPDAPIEDAVFLSLAKREGASAPVVTEAALRVLTDELTQTRYEGIRYGIVHDDGAMASAEISALMQNLLSSLVIVGVVLMLFLSPRAALVVVVSIPLTMLIVFGAGYLAGQTINRITLFALILSLGLLVDAAIVITESAYDTLRGHRVAGENDRTVVLRAANSVGVGLFLSMLTSVVVFLPMRSITGMMGPYMGPIAFFVPAALIVSFILAITVMPYLALRLLRTDERQWALSRKTAQGMHRLAVWYERVLTTILERRALQRKILIGTAGALTLALVLPLAGLTHFQMLPRADRDQYFIHLDMPAGTDVLRTRSIAEALAERALTDPSAISAQIFVATAPVLDFNGMYKGAHMRTAPHQASVRVNLTPKGERGDSSSTIVERMRTSLGDVPGVGEAESVRLIEDPPGPPVQATFVAKVSASDAGARERVAAELADRVRTIAGLTDVDTSIDRAYERLVLTLDHTEARAYGVAPAVVYDALLLLGGPLEAGQYRREGGEEYASIEVRIPRGERDAPADLGGVYVKNMRGEAVPIHAVVRESYLRDRPPLYAEGSEVTAYVTAETENRSIVYAMLDLMRDLIYNGVADLHVASWGLFGMTLTDGTDTVRIDWGGEWEMTLENFRDLGLAMLAALFLVYLVLVAQYRSFRIPGLILTTIPLGLIGILAGFAILDALLGVYLTATALIGFIALIGIVVNNAIILLERFDEARGEGKEFADALRDATASRLRPILLTSLTTVLGSLTIAFDPVWSGLAWAIVFGLTASTILTLVVFPTLMAYFSTEVIRDNS